MERKIISWYFDAIRICSHRLKTNVSIIKASVGLIWLRLFRNLWLKIDNFSVAKIYACGSILSGASFRPYITRNKIYVQNPSFFAHVDNGADMKGIDKIFARYANDPADTFGANQIGPNGMQRLLNDLGVSPTDRSVLVLAWKWVIFDSMIAIHTSLLG